MNTPILAEPIVMEPAGFSPVLGGPLDRLRKRTLLAGDAL
jgi:hypothetical protein